MRISKRLHARSFAKFVGLLLLFGLSVLSARKGTAVSALPEKDSGEEWPYYGHDAGGMRYSPLTQINRENVTRLKVAWTFHTGDMSDGSVYTPRSAFEATPLVIDGVMYVTTPFGRLIA